ncbi:putative UDP-glucose 4-epimerase [Sorangium cellulosum So ce56]|uniref:UDP-glucose 4-epimerase n=1 Tax=Sorangium cellulosum (strain So ce56) TaxID=448385 RepID=A9FZJ1_SORC5|nr:SDR family oxidoreductase [Sorangium cellulosum]CAN98758.1 putative UDP-glucose 4-epimerase [Sorangium cellulosum So ce56]
MRIFLTGASGFIGSAIVPELARAGHRVLGLARSDASAERLAAAGVDVHRGSLTDLDSLRRGAAACGGVIHCAFSHDDFTDYAGNCEKDRGAIEALGAALAGSGRPLVIASGIARFAPGRVASEDEAPDASAGGLRAASEQLALSFASRGVRVSSLRLPPSVHGDGDHGFVPMLIEIARKTGRSGYVGGGENRWPAVHRLDAARLFVLALEKAPAGARLHAIGEEGIPTRDIAGVIGRKLGVPVESVPREHFGWLGGFFALDTPASSALTQARFGWKPEKAGLLADIEHGTYFARAST